MIERRNDTFRMEPDAEQRQLGMKFVGCRRWVWNHALDLQLKRLEAKQPLLSYCELSKLLKEWRHAEETAWLAEAPYHTQQAALRDLDRAFQRWRQGISGLPRFKKRGSRESIRYPDHKQIKFDFETKDADGRTVLPRAFLPKLGWVKIRVSRQLFGEVCNATVLFYAGNWELVVQSEKEGSPESIPQTDENTVGGDVGICHFLVLSDGTTIEKPAHILRVEEALNIAQRKLSRMVKGSKNSKDQRKRIQRLHRKISRARNDFLHQTSAKLSKSHAYVKLEDANVQQMVKPTKAPIYCKGKPQSATQRARFNRRLLDIGWSKFLFYLDYKLRVRGGRLILVDPAYTSQECSNCGLIHEKNRPTRDRFHCQMCQHEDQADLNAAKVIQKRAGHARFACESFSIG